MNIVPEHDLLYVSLEECREVAAVGEVALVAVLLQHQTSRECLKDFENNINHSQLRQLCVAMQTKVTFSFNHKAGYKPCDLL